MRLCAYCGEPRCNCHYKFSKLGKRVITETGLSQESTAGEMLQTMVERFVHLPLDMRGTWIISFTEFDERKVERNNGRHAFRPKNKISN